MTAQLRIWMAAAAAVVAFFLMDVTLDLRAAQYEYAGSSAKAATR
ncbi:MAG TPA: hypothetical protein VL689_12230 [Paraburkholderia sp.]|jgi:hypothetical protein|nr:hypothetical protein [Paraburkholderia sp.]